MELIEKLQKIIEREIDNVPMVLTDPLTLRRLRAERLVQAALTALIEHAGGDGVTDADEKAAWETGIRLAKDDWLKLFQAFARHRATAFAAGKAAREREIVVALRRKGREQRWQRCADLADAIEQGEV